MRASVDGAPLARDFSWSEPRLNLWNHMKRKDNLPFLFLFQGNGFLREWALKQIDEPLRSAFEIIVIADLTNNWVEPVRLAADQAIERCYPKTSPHLFAEAFSYFHRTHQSWQRWSLSSSRENSRIPFARETGLISNQRNCETCGRNSASLRTLLHALLSLDRNPRNDADLRVLH